MQFVEKVGRVFVSMSEFYRDINPSTLTGAIDVVVVEDAAGNCCCSPFHVRFGKLQVFLPQDKIVEVSINNAPPLAGIKMKVGEAGECFFVVESLEPVPDEYSTSPLLYSQIPPIDIITKLGALKLDNTTAPAAARAQSKKLVYALSDSEVDYDTSTGPNTTKPGTSLKDPLISLSDSEMYGYDLSEDEEESKESQEKAQSSFWSWGWGSLPKHKESKKEDGREICALHSSPSNKGEPTDRLEASYIRSRSNSPSSGESNRTWPFWWRKKPEDSPGKASFSSVKSSSVNDLSQAILTNGNEKPSANKKDRPSDTGLDEKKPLPELKASTGPARRYFYKSLRLSSEQLQLLNLQRGVNSVTFTTARGATCAARIFFWPWDAKIVISDVDGTITKSDVLGHLYTMVGKDWTHSGVARLYSSIKSNGYEILYLTSRAIGQESFCLPDGPVIMSPDRLLTAFHREVILRRPDEFKIACLRDIRRLFEQSNNSHPFYAGFGNRVTDSISYLSVGIPAGRIFIINSAGEVRPQNLESHYQSSYLEMDRLAEHFFPPLTLKLSSSHSYTALRHDQWADWLYWRTMPPAHMMAEDDLQIECTAVSISSSPPSPAAKDNEKSPKKKEVESPLLVQNIEILTVTEEQESDGDVAEDHPYF